MRTWFILINLKCLILKRVYHVCFSFISSFYKSYYVHIDKVCIYTVCKIIIWIPCNTCLVKQISQRRKNIFSILIISFDRSNSLVYSTKKKLFLERVFIKFWKIFYILLDFLYKNNYLDTYNFLFMTPLFFIKIFWIIYHSIEKTKLSQIMSLICKNH